MESAFFSPRWISNCTGAFYHVTKDTQMLSHAVKSPCILESNVPLFESSSTLVSCVTLNNLLYTLSLLPLLRHRNNNTFFLRWSLGLNKNIYIKHNKQIKYLISSMIILSDNKDSVSLSYLFCSLGKSPMSLEFSFLFCVIQILLICKV